MRAFVHSGTDMTLLKISLQFHAAEETAMISTDL